MVLKTFPWWNSTTLGVREKFRGGFSFEPNLMQGTSNQGRPSDISPRQELIYGALVIVDWWAACGLVLVG